MGAPPTLHDPPRSPFPSPPRKSRAPLVAALLLIFAAALGLTAFGVYWTVFHYEPVAGRHVPPGTSLAVHVDLAELALFGPVRRNLLPLASASSSAPADAGKKPLAERIEEATGIHLSRDVRELVAVRVGSTDSGAWALIVGGKIPQGFVRGLAKVAEEEGAGWALSSSGDTLTVRGWGAAIGQATDGTLIVASDAATLAAALPEQENDRAIGLPESGAVGFAVATSAFREWGSGMASVMLASLRKLNEIDGCNGRFSLGDAPRFEAQCRVAQGADANELRTSMLGVVTDLRRLSELGGSFDLMGERQALADAQITATADGRVQLTAPWPLEGLERGAKSLASAIETFRNTFGTKPPPAATNLLPSIPGLPQIQLVPAKR